MTINDGERQDSSYLFHCLVNNLKFNYDKSKVRYLALHRPDSGADTIHWHSVQQQCILNRNRLPVRHHRHVCSNPVTLSRD